MLSTGRVVEDVCKVVIRKGGEAYTIWGRSAKPSVGGQIRTGGKLNTITHYVAHRFGDCEGLVSKAATRKMIHQIDEINPDIIHLHNIHDHYLNYPLLFEYLAKVDIPVVWTQHDCWAFTGGCPYPDLYKCEKWKCGCIGDCPEKRAFFCNRSKEQYELRRELIALLPNLTFVPVSDWLGGLLRQSMFSDHRIETIHNGIDTSVFKAPYPKRDHASFRILGVAAVWDKRKGLDDFVKLRACLPSEYEITLVGLSRKQIANLPEGIRGITRTTNVEELVQLYSNADVFVNPTYSDNFPTTNIEALACGTPVITYKTGGSPEAIDRNTGFVVEQGNVLEMANTIMWLRDHPRSSENCRKRAEEYFDKDKCFEKYVRLYEELMKK